MVAAGDAVDIMAESLRRIVAAYGVAGLQIALLPTSLFVQTGTGDSAHVQFSSQVVPRCASIRSMGSTGWSRSSSGPS